MSVVLRLLVLALLVFPAAARQEQLAQPDRNAFTFLNWTLDVRVETATESLFSRGKITLRNDSSQPQKRVALQISSSLKWASIRQNDSPLAFMSAQIPSDLDHSGKVQEAIVSLASTIPPGGSVELEVGYSGTISLDTTRLAQLGVPLEVRAATDYDRITPTFTCLRGIGHVLWFPAALDPAMMGDGNRVFEETGAWTIRHSLSSMTLTLSSDVPDLGYFVSNAQRLASIANGGVESVSLTWQHLGLAGPVLLGGHYQSIPAKGGREAPFRVAYFPDHAVQAQDYARVIANTPSMIEGPARIAARLVELPEAQDSTFEADTLLLTPLKTIDRKSLEVTLAYQLAHQSLWSPRAWIYAGAAHFAQALMRERQDGRAAAIAFMQQRLTPLTLLESGAPELLRANSLVNTTNEIFYRTKALYVWWMLREIVGQRALQDALQQYDPEADKEPSYIQKLLEKNSHKDLEWFFDDWVYEDRGLPEFTVSNGYARPSLQGIYLVSVTVENHGGAAAEVAVIVHTQNGDVVSRLRVAGHAKNAARIEVGSKPLEVTVNDGSVPELDRSDNTITVRIGRE